MPGPSGPSGPRPRACYYVYSAAAVVGLFVCKLYTLMQDGTTSTTFETLAFASDPHMKYVLDNLPADMSYDDKVQAIEGNYGKQYSQLHLWDVNGIIPKLTRGEVHQGQTKARPQSVTSPYKITFLRVRGYHTLE